MILYPIIQNLSDIYLFISLFYICQSIIKYVYCASQLMFRLCDILGNLKIIIIFGNYTLFLHKIEGMYNF